MGIDTTRVDPSAHSTPEARRTLIKVLLGVLVALIVVVGHYEYFWTGGTVHLLFGAKWAALSFDGKPVEIPSTSRHQRVEVRSGTTFVRVIQPSPMLHVQGATAEYTLEIGEGSDELLLPIDEEQCFVTLEVPKSADKYRLLARHLDHRPLDVQQVRYFGVEALPTSVNPRAGSVLLEQIACADANRNEAEILALLHL